MATADERLFQIFRHHDTIHAWLVGRRLLDVYDTTLLGWVISQMEWISRRTPPPLRRTVVRHLGADLRRVLGVGDRQRAARGQQGSDGAAAERGGVQARVRQLRAHPRQPARLEQPGRQRRVPPAALRGAAHGGAGRAVRPQPRCAEAAVTQTVSRVARVRPRAAPAGRDVRPDGDPAPAPRHGDPARRLEGRLGEHRAAGSARRVGDPSAESATVRRRRTGTVWQRRSGPPRGSRRPRPALRRW